MIPPVRLQRLPKPPPHPRILLNLRKGAVKNTIRTHFSRKQLFPDVVGAREGEGGDTGPHPQPARRDDLLTGGEDEFVGVGFTVWVFGRWLITEFAVGGGGEGGVGIASFWECEGGSLTGVVETGGAAADV